MFCVERGGEKRRGGRSERGDLPTLPRGGKSERKESFPFCLSILLFFLLVIANRSTDLSFRTISGVRLPDSLMLSFFLANSAEKSSE